MALYFEGDALGVVERAYEAGMTDNGKHFDAGVSTTVNVLNGADVLRLKVGKSVEAVDVRALHEACESGERVKVRFDLDFAFGKLQIVRIASAAA